MGSLALDCQSTQLCTRDNVAPSSIALAPARTPEPGVASPPLHNGSNHHHANGGTNHQHKPAKQRVFVYHGIIYAGEVVGRKCSVLQVKAGKQYWPKGQVAEYDACSNKHRLTFGKNGNRAQQPDEWFSLSETRFKWEGDPMPKAAANPTFSADAPAKDAAIGKKLKVYWPAMSRWYTGVVKAYDAKTDKHSIQYKDGDTQELVLRHEPVLWADKDDSFRSYEEQACSDQQHKANGVNGSQQRDGMRSAVANGTRSAGKHEGAAANGTRSAGKHEQPRSRRLSEQGTGAAAAVQQAEGARSDASHTGQAGTAEAAGGASVPGQAGVSTVQSMKDLPSAGTDNAGTAVNGTHQASGSAPSAAGATLGKHARDAAGQLHQQSEAGQKRMRRTVTAAKPAPAKGSKQASTRQASPRQQSPAVADPRAALVGARVGVYWKLDSTFYRGKITAFYPSNGKFQIKYDDRQVESLHIEKERVQWYMPRGRSAGFRPEMHSLMLAMGVEGLLPECAEQPAQVPQGVPAPTLDIAAVGWRISVHWGADGSWHDAEVLSFEEDKKRHHVLYLDGEHEWLDLAKEALVWHRASRHGAISAGLRTNETMPIARDALGWHVAVYWKDDRTFYNGTVEEYEASTGRHYVAYDDGEQEWLSLRNERIVWRLPPGEEDGSDEEGADEAARPRTKKGRPSRAGKGRFAAPTTSDDSWQDADEEDLEEEDDDVEMEEDDEEDDELQPRPNQRRRLSNSGRSDPRWHSRSRSTSQSDPEPCGKGGLLSPRLLAGATAGAATQKRHAVYPSHRKGANKHASQQPGAAAAGQLPLTQLPPHAGTVQQLRVTVPGVPVLPPLNTGRRSSATGECVVSPLCRLQSLRSPANVNLAVKITAGSAPPVPTAAAAAAAALAAAVPLHGALAKLEPEQQRRAAVLQLKLQRLSLMMGRLSTAAAANGWRLEQLHTPAPVQPSGNQHHAAQQPQQQHATAGPTLAAISLAEGQYVLAATAAAASANGQLTGRPPLQALHVPGVGPVSFVQLSPQQVAQLQAQGLGGSLINITGQQPAQGANGDSAAPSRTMCVPKSVAIKSKPCSPHGLAGSGTGRLTIRLPARANSSSSSGSGGAGQHASAAAAAQGQQQQQQQQQQQVQQASPSTATPAGGQEVQPANVLGQGNVSAPGPWPAEQPQARQQSGVSACTTDADAAVAAVNAQHGIAAAAGSSDRPVVCLPGTGAPSPLPVLPGGAITPAPEGLSSPDMEEDHVCVDEFLRQGGLARGQAQPASVTAAGEAAVVAAAGRPAAAATGDAADAAASKAASAQAGAAAGAQAAVAATAAASTAGTVQQAVVQAGAGEHATV